MDVYISKQVTANNIVFLQVPKCQKSHQHQHLCSLPDNLPTNQTRGQPMRRLVNSWTGRLIGFQMAGMSTENVP